MIFEGQNKATDATSAKTTTRDVRDFDDAEKLAAAGDDDGESWRGAIASARKNERRDDDRDDDGVVAGARQ